MLFHDIGKPRCFTVDEKGIGHFKGHEEISAEMAKTGVPEAAIDGMRDAVDCNIYFFG